MQFTYQVDDLNDEFMDKSIDKGTKLISSMSKTIDDFRDFFKPNKQKEYFFIAQTIKDTIEHKEDHRDVYICNYDKNDHAVIEIRDNAGEVYQEIITKIFDPYFTTKEEGKGTGIGLYMTKTIVESNMGRKLSVSNQNGGAKFTIVFALKKSKKQTI